MKKLEGKMRKMKERKLINFDKITSVDTFQYWQNIQHHEVTFQSEREKKKSFWKSPRLLLTNKRWKSSPSVTLKLNKSPRHHYQQGTLKVTLLCWLLKKTKKTKKKTSYFFHFCPCSVKVIIQCSSLSHKILTNLDYKHHGLTHFWMEI